MLETGRILQIDNDKALICTDNITGRADCDGGCLSCKENPAKNKKSIWVKNSSQVPVHIDDRVEIYYPAGKTIKAAFLVLIFPLLLFFLFYFMAILLFKQEGELIRIISGFSGIGLAFLMNFILQKLNKNPELPEITRKIN